MIETGGQLVLLQENLNYSAQGLLTTFKTHFSPADANAYARKPHEIANRAYANRNGNEASGDGWLYRGRGFCQITSVAITAIVAWTMVKVQPNPVLDTALTNLSALFGSYVFGAVWDRKVALTANVANRPSTTPPRRTAP